MRKQSLKRPSTHRRKYRSVQKQKTHSDQFVSWEEQKELGREFPEFLEVGKGSWPVERILKEDTRSRNKKWYYIKWVAHPKTGHEFDPVWRIEADLTETLLAEWRTEQAKKAEQEQRKEEARKASKLRQRRRIIPDSSPETAEEVYDPLHAIDSPSENEEPRTPESGVEISETQQESIRQSLEIILPPLSQDRAVWETLPSSQPEPYSDHSSPIDRIHDNLTQSQHFRVLAVNPRAKSAYPSPRTPSYVKSRHELDVSSSAYLLQSQTPKPAHFVQNTPSPSLEDIELQTQHIQQPSLAQSRLPNYNSHTLASIPSTYPSRQLQSSQIDLEEQGLLIAPDLSQRTERSLFCRIRTISSSPPQFNRSQKSILRHIMDGHDAEHGSPVQDQSSATNGNLVLNSDVQDHAAEVIPEPISFTIQESIENEDSAAAVQPSSALMERMNSSQASLDQERQVETVDGIMIPTRPILGSNEYAIPLTAEGRVISVYKDTIKIQEKAILRFIRRKGSPGSSNISNKKTSERIEMQNMLQRLSDITTHVDLGLPGLQTQHSLGSQEESVYATYAGSKFVMLGALIDKFKDTDSSFVILAQGGALQDMLSQYLKMKHVGASSDVPETQDQPHTSPTLSVDLLDSQASQLRSVKRKPLFIIAFDASFPSAAEQVRQIREQHGSETPIIHFLVINSSEHVEKCVTESMTSNIRLKIVVRTTYLSADHLGGSLTYFQSEADLPKDGSMPGMGEYQRGLVKSPARKMTAMADAIYQAAVVDKFSRWDLPTMPELELDILHSPPPRIARGGTRTPLARGQTPASRAGTPSRKRMLDAESELSAKRLRMTPIRDIFEQSNGDSSHKGALLQLQKDLDEARASLAQEKAARSLAENKLNIAETQTDEWRENLASLQRRYEKRRSERIQLEKANKKLTKDLQNMSMRNEKVQEEKAVLKAQIAELKKDLAGARADLTNAGGDVAVLEAARAEARDATEKKESMEKSLTSTKETSEYVRIQYQEASDRARDLSDENRGLEDKIQQLEKRASDLPRQLKSMNYEAAVRQYIRAGDQMQYEVKARNALIRKIHEENTALKSKRGVQTRGSSVQPVSSPGPRSRQNSPAPYGGHLAPPVAGSRASALRHGG